MPTRRSHHKSRNGCESCKRRRIKCDERRPACGECRMRSTSCIFPDPVRSSPAATVQSDESAGMATVATPSATPPSSLLSQAAETAGPIPSSKLTELKLMHQWSTTTYKSMCGAETKDHHTWQVLVPLDAFKHDFLLYGILTTSSLELAMASENGQWSSYLKTALQYQNLALSSFRDAVVNITEANHQAIFTFSVITMVLSLALPQCERSSMLQSMLFHFDLLQGLILVTQTSLDWLRKGPFQAHLRPIEEIPVGPLDPNTKVALDRLNAVNEERNNSARKESRLSELRAMTYHAASRKAIFHLEEMFARCAEPLNRGHSLAWLQLAGHEYVQAVKDSEPVALLILMHWGVLADRIRGDIWWAQSGGKNLVDELSYALDSANDPLIAASVIWARGQVGLQGANPPAHRV